jgi:hypothetical protein
MDEDQRPIIGIGVPVSIDELVNNAPNDKPPLAVLVNAGFGKGSYACKINDDSTMSLPEDLVNELKLTADDDLAWAFNEDDRTIYLRVIHRDWEAPEWLQD